MLTCLRFVEGLFRFSQTGNPKVPLVRPTGRTVKHSRLTIRVERNTDISLSTSLPSKPI